MRESTRKLMERGEGADQLKQQKTRIRRTVTELHQQVKYLGDLLTAVECQQLCKAADVLDRWAVRANQAYVKKQSDEQDAKAERERRSAIAHAVFCERYAPTDLHEKIIITCALSAVHSSLLPALSASKLESEMQWFDSHPDRSFGCVTSFMRIVDEALRNVTEDLIDDVTWNFNQEPVDEAITRLSLELDSSIERHRALLTGLLAECDEWLVRYRLIESGTSVAG